MEIEIQKAKDRKNTTFGPVQDGSPYLASDLTELISVGTKRADTWLAASAGDLESVDMSMSVRNHFQQSLRTNFEFELPVNKPYPVNWYYTDYI